MCGRDGRFSSKDRLEQVIGFGVDGRRDVGMRYKSCPGLLDWAMRRPGLGGDSICSTVVTCPS
jgi:hypothetical protein